MSGVVLSLFKTVPTAVSSHSFDHHESEQLLNLRAGLSGDKPDFTSYSRSNCDLMCHYYDSEHMIIFVIR